MEIRNSLKKMETSLSCVTGNLAAELTKTFIESFLYSAKVPQEKKLSLRNDILKLDHREKLPEMAGEKELLVFPDGIGYPEFRQWHIDLAYKQCQQLFIVLEKKLSNS